MPIAFTDWAGKWLGPPAAFLKALVAIFCFLLSSYVNVLPKVSPSWVGILNASTMLGLLGGALFSGAILLLWMLPDFLRAEYNDRLLGLLTVVIGFFILDAMQQLAEDRIAYLETFVALMAGILVASAIEAKAFQRRRTEEAKTAI